MRAAPSLPLIALVALAACATPVGSPSRAPRSAEAIDPRVPVVNPVTDGAADPALTGRLGQLVGQARSGEAAFARAIGEAQRLAAAAGGRESEGWIAAQQALSAAVAAREPTTRALGDIDALAASQLEQQRTLAPADLAAVQEAQATVGAIDRAQHARILAVSRRLGI